MFGVALRDTGLSIPDLCTLARIADDAGYAGIWLPEVGSRDAVVVATILAEHTRGVTVGTGVIPVYSRNVVSLALSVATAAEAARGRFVLGLGAGHRFTADAWYGGGWRAPRRRMRETIDVLRRILAGERVSHDGEFHLAAFHLGSSPPDVPVYVGALTPASLRLAGEIADGAILNWMPPAGMERASLLVRESAADAGRAVRVLGYVRVAVVHAGEDPSVARAAVREQTYSYASLPAYAAAIRQVGLRDALDRMAEGDEGALDELTDALCAVGEAQQVRDKLASFADCGLDQVVVYPVPFGDDAVASVLRTVRALA